MTQTSELSTPDGVEVVGALQEGYEAILSEDALAFIAGLHRAFDARRKELLQRRDERQVEFDNGALPDFLSDTEEVRFGSWQVAPTPEDLQQRWAEITGPVDRKMMIGALNSGADAFMADFEDALSPTWDNIVSGQINARDAVRREISFENPDGSVRTLNEQIATLLIRPRGWHLDEKHVLVDGEPISASLFDFGMYMFHNAAERVARGTGPYFYLPKLESHLEARLWNDAFVKAQDDLGVPQGSVRATVLIETLPAAFEMEEILYEPARSLGGPQRGALGLHFLSGQALQVAADLHPARSGAGDDDDAVHARLHRVAGAHLPQARRSRDGRDGGVHSLAAGPRDQRDCPDRRARRQGARVDRRVRRDLGRASRPRVRGARHLRDEPQRRAQPA